MTAAASSVVLATGPASANIGVPIIGVLVVVVIVGGILYAVLRKR
ncbi:hypothetical protein [Amnibacterium endophyticum]|uniref:LPXTG cell wall anchor domain-containing protein n=1 Tax=Amnibacterium endophyticum TaxID=2109337 RepID=A0ABW4LET3_9MICO